VPLSTFTENRFGYGTAISGPSVALTDQFERFDPKPSAIAALPPRSTVANEFADFMEQTRELRGAQTDGMDAKDAKDQQQAARKMIARAGLDHYATAVEARFATAVSSKAPFVERLVHFWANHFAVSADKVGVTGFAGLLEMEAIRPNVLGRFEDMLIAVEQHPAMLLYLDQAQSIGPDSAIGARISARGNRKVGLNENLAREILELHTLGARTGYSQTDVTEFARALTGWTVSGIAKGPVARAIGLADAPGNFIFADQVHQPGNRAIMGKSYSQQGLAQGRAILGNLARHPSTARHIATKLARHFEGDEPSETLVSRLQASFLKTGGDLKSLYRVLAQAPEILGAKQSKFKTPWEWLVSTHRSVDLGPATNGRLVQVFTQLGQPIWRPGSPAGFDDIAPSWAGPDALFRRAELSEQLTRRIAANADPRAIAVKALGNQLTPATAQAIARAESPMQGAALLLVSPEFLRR
jgi:uncharacterized protein (DUF1800 family)